MCVSCFKYLEVVMAATIQPAELQPLETAPPHTARVSFCDATLIGAGTFKEVHLAELQGKHVAAVSMLVGNLASTMATLHELRACPNLVQLIGSVNLGGDDGPNPTKVLCLEYTSSGTLLSLLHTQLAPSMGHKHLMLAQVARGMRALAEARVVHSDLSLKKVFVFAYAHDNVNKVSHLGGEGKKTKNIIFAHSLGLMQELL